MNQVLVGIKNHVVSQNALIVGWTHVSAVAVQRLNQ